MSIIIDSSIPLTLNSLSNLNIINKINSNTQLFINSNMLSNVLLPYTTSNYIISTSNILQTNINTKQNILTASTSLLGNGAAITNLAYANITGKPTNFQADWTSTVINKPSTFPADMTTIYTKTENNNINGGYWGIVPDNFNYIRLISGVVFDTTVIIQPLLL